MDFLILVIWVLSAGASIDWYRTGNIFGLGPAWLRVPMILFIASAALITTVLMCVMASQFSATYENNGMTIRYEQLFGRTPTK